MAPSRSNPCAPWCPFSPVPRVEGNTVSPLSSAGAHSCPSMPARPRRRPKSARVWVKVALTRAEAGRLRRLAAADFRSVGSLATWLVAQELARTKARPRPVRSASRSDRRAPLSVLLTMPIGMRDRLEAAAQREMRSVSGYEGRVVLGALASR